MEIALDHLKWELKGFYPYVPLLANSVETGESLKGVTEWIPAIVPGGVHNDLYKAGYIQDPHKDLNSLSCEWVENRWWMYRTSFPRPANTGKKVELICKGLDYKARVYLNNTFLGEHEGMFHPAIFDISEIVRDNASLELRLLFENAPQEQAQIGRTSLTHTQKSRFSYKWDFSTRLVSIGIWDEILLKIHEELSIGEINLQTDVEDEGTGIINLSIKLDHYGEEASEDCWIEAICRDPEGNQIEIKKAILLAKQEEQAFLFRVEQPQLWYPNGHGKQPLYELILNVGKGDVLLDSRKFKPGIRKLRYMQNEQSPSSALPYTFLVNDKKIYIKGCNLTPLDLLYGSVTTASYEWAILMMKHAHMNLVRVWGGGIIEKNVFYELCDRHGIMVWQEFIQSSSGVESIPSKQPKFLELMTETAEAALKDRRNYVSLSAWSGGNELMDQYGKPCGYEDENIAILKTLVQAHDPNRIFLPTSASGPEEMISLEKGKNHDVHGSWKYLGNPEHYEFYGKTDSLFHSEFGVDGLSNVKSLRKFLDPAHIKVTDMDTNLVWRHHGEWWDTLKRDELFFGKLTEIETFARCSQWIQAEGIRFIVEANRRRQFQNSGSVIWQLNEPWPNVSCTSLTDYYGEGKMAYYWTRKAFAPIHASLDYSKLVYQEGESFCSGLFIDGSGSTDSVTVIIKVKSTEGLLLWQNQYEGKPLSTSSMKLGELKFMITADFSEVFFVELQLLQKDQSVFENSYIFSKKAEFSYKAALEATEGNLSVNAVGEWGNANETFQTQYVEVIKRTFQLTNDGKGAALHVYPEEITDHYWMLSSDSFASIFPNEVKELTVYCVRKQLGGFLANDVMNPVPEEMPEILFRHLCSVGL